ncbi:hypothetical protein BDZ89DRAFT_1007317 [Hymenopellis radicata]|nr:hypothetical protein BDZ89DRAFT_1007317 [Hymenopellis radicata]
MSSEAQIKEEIARLTANINLVKAGKTQTQDYQFSARKNNYYNPNYKPRNTYVRPAAPAAPPPRPSASSSQQMKEVVLNGVAFESSGRSLVRKDLPKPVSSAKPPSSSASRPSPPQFSRKAGHMVPSHRVYKPTSSRGRRGGPVNRNMTLTNNRRPYQFVSSSCRQRTLTIVYRRKQSKRIKYSDKPCSKFSTTGVCSRGLTCRYQHDGDKVAICWNFLQGNCSKTAESCELSHDPTPQRTPLCMHFLNKGRCTRVQCPFPHVNVGARNGVCRDFAVLGYCAKGLDCDHQHVRECPDFAEKGTCSTKGCKLPHVIRANRNRKPAASTTEPAIFSDTTGSTPMASESAPAAGQLGDEFISLTFIESENEEESDEEEEEDEDDDDDDDNDDHNDNASGGDEPVSDPDVVH